jgi:catechol 2,3-dioxygenase-like lactoylglutathione lyase family enzyme
VQVFGIGWVGTRTTEYDEMRDFLANVLGLSVGAEQTDAVVFDLADGSAFELFKPTDTDHDFFSHPVAGILVDDVREVRAHLERHGIGFIGDVHVGVESSWATEWSHFRAPDGQVYVLVSRPRQHPGESPRHFRELRICVKVTDLDAAVRLYRDGLGLPVVDSWTHPGGQRGALLGVCPAAIELFDEAQWDFMDRTETGALVESDHALRVEVNDLAGVMALAARLEEAGATRTGELVQAPWEQDCLRMSDGQSTQLTLFTLPADEKVTRERARRKLPY